MARPKFNHGLPSVEQMEERHRIITTFKALEGNLASDLNELFEDFLAEFNEINRFYGVRSAALTLNAIESDLDTGRITEAPQEIVDKLEAFIDENATEDDYEPVGGEQATDFEALTA